MNLSSSFDLDEFLNYLIPGAFFLVIFLNCHPQIFEEFATIDRIKSDDFRTITTWVVLLTLAVTLGHFFSMVVRYFIRNLINSVLGDPEETILRFEADKSDCDTKQMSPIPIKPVACADFFSVSILEAFRGQFQMAFSLDLDEPTVRKAAPRLVRSYVLHRSESARDMRNGVIRPRSFNANMAVSFLFSSIVSITVLPLSIHALFWCATLILMIKQRSLDEREAKELYTHFLSLDIKD